ncbi:MAG: hypothetical protein AMXMBFR7_38640 [Planctomycetota bacterium]
MAELYNKYADQGFHIVGLECQGSAKDAIVSMAQGKGVKFQLTTGGDLRGANVRGIPHGFLFGADGKLAVEDPRGAELEKKVKELLNETSAAMAGPGPYTKLAAQAAQIKAGQGLGAVLKTLRTKVNSTDAAEAGEAKMMFEALEGAAKRQLDSALARKAEDPAGSLKNLERISLQFAGDEIGETAKKEAQTMRNDPAVKKELEAAGVWLQIEKMNEALKPVAGQKNPRNEQFRRANAAAIQQMMGGCQMLVQRYPGTKAAQQAEDLMSQYK